MLYCLNPVRATPSWRITPRQFDSVREIHSCESGAHSEGSGETPTAALVEFSVRLRKENTESTKVLLMLQMGHPSLAH